MMYFVGVYLYFDSPWIKIIVQQVARFYPFGSQEMKIILFVVFVFVLWNFSYPTLSKWL